MAMKILLLERDEALRESFKGLLTQTAFGVDRCVANGDEMLEAYTKSPPAAVVIDMNAPGHKDKPGDGGMAHLKRLLDLDANARIAVTYTLENKMLVMNALKAGAIAKIKKPFRREEIIEALAVCTGKTKSANVNRAGVRLKKSLALKYKKTTDGFFTRMRNGITDDISPTGISFRTEENLQEKTSLKVEISLPGQPAIAAKGQVVRVKPVVGLPMVEIAFTFTDLSPDEADRLRSFILQNVAKMSS
ncbi:MAG: PilZ domain-containing protein [Planctomycetes bacterium]|nr:PilZ domain-containing protein [Planctomycetota bacterium]